MLMSNPHISPIAIFSRRGRRVQRDYGEVLFSERIDGFLRVWAWLRHRPPLFFRCRGQHTDCSGTAEFADPAKGGGELVLIGKGARHLDVDPAFFRPALQGFVPKLLEDPYRTA